MDNFKDVYSINFGEDFYKLSIKKKKEMFEKKFKEYLTNKVWLKNKLGFYENLSIYRLVELASDYYGDEAVADLVHVVLNFAGNLQGYHIVWYSSDTPELENSFEISKDGKWSSFKTPLNESYVDIFNFVYNNFEKNFVNYDNKLLNRFMEYVNISTNSDSKSQEIPSSINQIYFAKKLFFELQAMGLSPIFDKNYGYVYAKLDGDKDIPSIGFISHMDTSEDVKDDNINPLIINDYYGEDITYEGRTLLSVKDNPDLLNHVGETLITTDGTTLLGADDKAGIAEIMGMIEYYKNNDEPHGDIYIAFTPDEEIGKSIDYLDRNIFNPKYAYTVDGEYLGEISYENFNAADVTITIQGNNVHPGYAKDKMVNALLIANMINSLLPKNEIPENTSDFEGFYHLHRLNGTVSESRMFYLVRDFDKNNFQTRIDILKEIVDKLNKQYGNCIEINVEYRYNNMKEIIENNIEIVEIAKRAIEKAGVIPYVKPIRGGTDGTRLSFEGIPCPNLGAGGHNFHSNQEYVTLENMEMIKDILIGIVKEFYLTYKKEDEIVKSKKK